jgi:hypothetical protein
MSAQTKLPPSTANPNLPTPPPLEKDVDVDTVIYSFLDAFPDPTDEQVFYLGRILGFEPHEFEAKISELLDQDEVLHDFDPEDPEDPDLHRDTLDLFMLALFLFEPNLSNGMINDLAELLGMSVGDLDTRINRLLVQDQGIDPDLDDLDDLDEEGELSGLEDLDDEELEDDVDMDMEEDVLT